MDEFTLQEMKKDIARHETFIQNLLKKIPPKVQKELEDANRGKRTTPRQHAEHGHSSPHFEELDKMSIERLKQRLGSHDQNERETFSPKEASEWKKQRGKILTALQKAVKQKRTKNVSK